MSRTRFVVGCLVVFLAAGIVVITKGRGSGTKTTPAPKAAAPAPHTTKTPAGKSAQTRPPKPSPTRTPKTDKTTTATAKTATNPVKLDKAADPKMAKADKPAKTTKSTTATSASTSTKTTSGATTTTELTPVQQKLKQNTNLAAKVSSRLPEGTDLMKAAEGFKNLGQFVAAANVSHNLQISFTELKAKMMTGMSLGQAIQAVRPLTASPTVEAQRAEYDARGMIAESEQSATATPSTVPSAMPASTTAKPKVKTKNSAQ